MSSNNPAIPSATVEEHGDKTVISVVIPKAESEFTLHTAPDVEQERADRKRRLEYNDRYGEPLIPGGIMSVAQEEGEEEIPTPPGGVVSSAGALNMAVEQHRLNERKAGAEADRVANAPQETQDKINGEANKA